MSASTIFSKSGSTSGDAHRSLGSLMPPVSISPVLGKEKAMHALSSISPSHQTAIHLKILSNSTFAFSPLDSVNLYMRL